MIIQSSTLNSRDYNYFINNFKIVNGNVNSIEEADSIFLGDVHDSSVKITKNIWLFNRLVKKNDKLFVEGDSGRLKIYTSPFFPYIPHDIELYGWDSIEVHKWNRQTMSKVDKILSLFEECVNTPSRKLVIESIGKISKLANHKIFKNSILKIKELNPAYTEYDLKLVGNQNCIFESLFEVQRQIVELTRICECPDEELESISDTELNKIFSLFLNRTHTFFRMHFEFISQIVLMLDRNMALAKSIAKLYEKPQKLFILAGIGHLKKKSPEKEDIGSKLAYEVLMRQLSHKKFIILSPSKNDKDVGEMAIDLEWQRKTRYQFPAICSVAISVIFGLIGAYNENPVISLSFASISLISLGILACRFKNLLTGITPKEEKVLYDYRFITNLPRRWHFLEDKISILKI